VCFMSSPKLVQVGKKDTPLSLRVPASTKVKLMRAAAIADRKINDVACRILDRYADEWSERAAQRGQ
jgi:uncharacterized protein (DUF1778 family)